MMRYIFLGFITLTGEEDVFNQFKLWMRPHLTDEGAKVLLEMQVLNKPCTKGEQNVR